MSEVRLPYRSKKVTREHPPEVLAFLDDLEALQAKHGVWLEGYMAYGQIDEQTTGNYGALLVTVPNPTFDPEAGWEDGKWQQASHGYHIGDDTRFLVRGAEENVEDPWTPEELELHHEGEAKALRERQAREKAECGRRCRP